LAFLRMGHRHGQHSLHDKRRKHQGGQAAEQSR
jgi:hypothetical protein